MASLLVCVICPNLVLQRGLLPSAGKIVGTPLLNYYQGLVHRHSTWRTSPQTEWI